MKIKWTAKAEADYISILDYLLFKFTIIEVRNFTKLTEDTLLLISKNSLMFPIAKKKSVHKCVLVKQVSMYYRVNKNSIELLAFWDNRRNPKDLKY